MRDTYAGLTAELFGLPARQQHRGAAARAAQFPAVLRFTPRRANNPTNIKVDTKAVYLIETANFQDVVILNGGVRFDDYNISGFNASRRHHGQSFRHVQLQRRRRREAAALCEPLCRLCDVVESRRRGARCGQRRLWRVGLQLAAVPGVVAGAEQGQRGRDQMGAVRPSSAGDRRAVPDRSRPMRARPRAPTSSPARPIASAASISRSPARSPTNGASSAAWC